MSIILDLPKIDLIAFDPGERSGLAHVIEGKLVTTEILTKEQVLHNFSLNIPLGSGFVEHWVCESFMLYGHKAKTQIGSQMPSAQVIGMLKLAAAQRGIELHFQTAQEAKKRCPDEVLKRYGFYVPSSEDHAKDASRHALCWLIKKSVEQK